jgi:16S rRNA processing protein RimM
VQGERLVPLGALVGTHGVRGELRLRPFNPDSALLGELQQVHLVAPDGRVRGVTIEAARHHQTVWLIKIAGVRSMDDARSLIGSRIAVREVDLPPLGQGQFYHYQIVGLAVVDEAGESWGRVSSVLSAGGNDVLVITDDAGRERMVPMIDQAVRSIDAAAGRIVVRPLDGLFEDE